MIHAHSLKLLILGHTVWAALITAPTGASAASDNPIQGILGGIINSVQQQATREKWKQLPDEILQCMDLGLRSSGSSVSASITKSVGPDSREFDATRNICDQLLNRPLRLDFPCVLTDKKARLQRQIGKIYGCCQAQLIKGVIVHLRHMSPSSLANLIANGHGLRVFCSACYRCRDLDVGALAQRYVSVIKTFGTPEPVF
jgi:hypothetical protein